jgi:hypothetical protein
VLFFADVPADGPCSSHLAIDEGRPFSSIGPKSGRHFWDPSDAFSGKRIARKTGSGFPRDALVSAAAVIAGAAGF